MAEKGTLVVVDGTAASAVPTSPSASSTLQTSTAAVQSNTTTKKLASSRLGFWSKRNSRRNHNNSNNKRHVIAASRNTGSSGLDSGLECLSKSFFPFRSPLSPGISTRRKSIKGSNSSSNNKAGESSNINAETTAPSEQAPPRTRAPNDSKNPASGDGGGESSLLIQANIKVTTTTTTSTTSTTPISVQSSTKEEQLQQPLERNTTIKTTKSKAPWVTASVALTVIAMWLVFFLVVRNGWLEWGKAVVEVEAKDAAPSQKLPQQQQEERPKQGEDNSSSWLSLPALWPSSNFKTTTATSELMTSLRFYYNGELDEQPKQGEDNSSSWLSLSGLPSFWPSSNSTTSTATPSELMTSSMFPYYGELNKQPKQGEDNTPSWLSLSGLPSFWPSSNLTPPTTTKTLHNALPPPTSFFSSSSYSWHFSGSQEEKKVEVVVEEPVASFTSLVTSWSSLSWQLLQWSNSTSPLPSPKATTLDIRSGSSSNSSWSSLVSLSSSSVQKLSQLWTNSRLFETKNVTTP